MANWSNPTLSSTYTNFLSELKARDTDLALQFDGTTSSNLATGTIRWNSTTNRWQKWSGSAWAELTGTYALTALTTTGDASIGGTLAVTGATTLAAATATTPATGNNSTAVATTAYVRAQAYAPLASPALTGTPTVPSAAVDTNTTQAASTAFVLGQASSTAPVINGTAAVGSSLRYSRQDHVHPIDTSRAALASPTFTGTPAAPTAAVGTNTTQLATTAFVNAEIANDAPTKTGTGASGTWGISVTGSAATLTTARTLWGQSFNGSANITGNLTAVGNITGSGAVVLASGGTNQAVTINTSGIGSIVLDTGTAGGTIQLRGGASGTRIYNAANTYYVATNVEALTANRSLTLPDGNVTLVTGTMVPTTGTGATGSWGISVTGSSASCTGNSATATTATNCSRSVLAGNGVTGGGALSANVTLTLGTPSSLTGSTTNTVTATSHTHAITVDLGVTAGTTAGPVITSSAGTNATIPSASSTAAGIVTTGAQTFAGVKTFASPAFTGTPTAPTAAAGTETTQVATTAFVSTGGASGAVMFFARNSAPSGWLKANGAAISRTTYATLFTAIGTAFGAGDGSTTFNVPDLRGQFPRGWDDGRGIDSGRTFGSAQDDALESHSHTMRNVAYDNLNTGTFVKTFGYLSDTGTGSSTGVTGGTETRPRNVALLACIKF